MGEKRLALVAIVALLSAACASSGPPQAPDRAAAPTSSPGEGPVTKPKGDKTPQPAEPVENPAPDFAFETFEGETFRLSEHRGAPVVLNFWESW